MNQFANTSLSEKQPNYYNPSPSPAPPPAYGATNLAPSVATASAVYEYHPSDAGDLAIQPNDRILITEFMNADWAKGRNERTGQEGIFPRSYVNIVDDKSALAAQVKPPPTPSNYGNMPLDVSQNGGGGAVGGAAGGPNSKLNQNGKKFGKKLGNAGESESSCLDWGSCLSPYSCFRCWRYYRLKYCQRDFLRATCRVGGTALRAGPSRR